MARRKGLFSDETHLKSMVDDVDGTATRPCRREWRVHWNRIQFVEVCYRFGAGQNTRTLIDGGGGGGGGGSYCESHGRVCAGGSSGGCGPGAVRQTVRCRARRRRRRQNWSVAEPCRRFHQTGSDRAAHGHWQLSKPFRTRYYHTRTGSGE